MYDRVVLVDTAIIATNMDRYCLSGKEIGFAAKKDRWTGVVHLHGYTKYRSDIFVKEKKLVNRYVKHFGNGKKCAE